MRTEPRPPGPDPAEDPSPLIALLDYQAGNLGSALRGLCRAGARVVVTDDAAVAAGADALVVPGVGHFSACLTSLCDARLTGLVTDWVAGGRPLLGICVGMQLLYEHSEEGGRAGLGVLPGRVVRLPDTVRVPHMGWDVVTAASGHEDDPLLDGIAGRRAYFVHSYFPRPADPAHVVATCSYPEPFPCVVRAAAGDAPTDRMRAATVGTQFHPEKSGDVGARLLVNWVAEVRASVARTGTSTSGETLPEPEARVRMELQGGQAPHET